MKTIRMKAPRVRSWRKLGALVSSLALGIALAACGGGNATPASGGSSGGSGSAGGSKGTITLGFIPSWTDGLSTAYLLKNRLTAMGYTVKLDTLSEAAPLYAGLAKGNVDIYPSAWPEVTHKAYMEKYGANIEDLDTYYKGAKLTIAVPKYMSNINSIADLKGKASEFNGKIIGIEPGAGLTKITKEQVIPQYGLSKNYTLVTSSTTAMLTELKKATDAKKPIVVTLWKPFWANTAFPVKTLKDPKGALGPSEGLHFLAHKGFSAKYPEVAKFIGGIKLDDQQYGSLENMVVNKYGKGKEAAAVSAWLKQNPNVLPALPAS